ncbi:MAG: penicillin-binding protein, partial [Elusimicrobia bacterium]|nr:penicillin-binding protein [Elusimicrobiota bacterium]
VKAAYYASRMGISSPLPQTLSLALGSAEVTPLELTSAFGVFANDGIMTVPYDIIRIEDFEGNTIKENYPKEMQVLSPQTNFIMTNLLQQACTYGTGWYTRRIGRPLGGKTGTTNNASDVWFTGFTPDLVTSVWMGYDERVTLGPRRAGGGVAAPIWTDYIRKALAHTPVLDFQVPDGIVFVNVDPETGLLASDFSDKAILQPFIKGTEPLSYF